MLVAITDDQLILTLDIADVDVVQNALTARLSSQNCSMHLAMKSNIDYNVKFCRQGM